MKQTPLKAILALGLLSLTPISNYAQTGGLAGSAPDPKLAQGATASGLSGIYNPNIFDGSTTISVPIHQFSQEEQQYGVSLSYNTLGVKVNECSSEIGTHWNLQAGGSIVRVVKDLPDELNITTEEYVYFNDTSFLNKNRFLKGKFVTYTETPAQQTEPNVYRDSECDDFIFSCGGQTFTFNLGSEMSVFTHPHRNVKIRPMIDNTPVFGVVGQPVGNWGSYPDQGVLSFVVTDESGTQYYFTKGDYETRTLRVNEYYEQAVTGNCYTVIRWMISKVVFANGNEIRYNYGQEPAYNSGAGNYRQYYAKEIWSGSSPTSATYQGEDVAGSGQYTHQLTGIQYPNGTEATFTYDAVKKNELGASLLQEVRISSGANCLRYKLNQVQTNDRWFLNSVRLASCDGTKEEAYYSFEYNPLALPARLNSAQDFYGYYNGNATGTALQTSGTAINIPVHHNQSGSLSYLNYGNSRLPNSNFAQAGILTKVRNAFGGEVSFLYSGNNGNNAFTGSSVTLPGSATSFVGLTAGDGLRVESVTEKEMFHPENTRVTVYDYYNSGQLFMPGGYFHYPEYADSVTGHWDKVIFQNMFLTSHQMINGANHGYSRVGIRNYTNTGQLLNAKDLSFTNMNDETSGFQPRYYASGKHYFEYPYTDKQYLKDWELGLPLQVLEYDQNNRIVKSTEHVYSFSPVNPAPGFSNIKKTRVNSGTGINLGNTTDPRWYYPNRKTYTDTYVPYTGKAFLQRSKVKTYVTDTRYVEDSTVYGYDGRDNIKYVTTLNSKGEKIKTEYVYNYDAGGTGVSGGAAPGSVLYNMTEGGLEKVISIARWKQGNSMFDQRLIDATINTFSYQGGVLRSLGAYSLQSQSPVGFTAYTGLTMGGPTGNAYGKAISAFQGSTPSLFEKTTEIKLTDTKGNPLETQVLGQEIYKAMIWDTEKGKLLAEAANARYADIAFSGFEASIQGNLAYNTADIEPATAVPGGSISGDRVLSALSSNSSPLSHNGLTPGKTYTLHFWCYGGLPQFAGAGLGQIPLTVSYSQNGWSFYTATFTPANSSSLGFTATGSPGSPFVYYLDDVRIFPVTATMQNYNYTPLFGISASTDATGRITYYEYDKLGRQTLVRDQRKNIVSKTKYYTGAGL